MRTKTLALSALLGIISSASLVAQTNVYSLNAVGYINAPIASGFNIVTCPLIASPDNTIGTLLPNGGGGTATSNQYNGWAVFTWTGSGFTEDLASAKQANKLGYTNGWESGGTATIAPGQAVWIDNPGPATTVTFVGTVPQNGSQYMTNVLQSGFNMVGSAVPMSGDLTVNTNTLMKPATSGGFVQVGDTTFFWDVTLSPAGYDTENLYSGTKHGWEGAGNPSPTNLTQGFWYDAASTETWVENFSINP